MNPENNTNESSKLSLNKKPGAQPQDKEKPPSLPPEGITPSQPKKPDKSKSLVPILVVVSILAITIIGSIFLVIMPFLSENPKSVQQTTPSTTNFNNETRRSIKRIIPTKQTTLPTTLNETPTEPSSTSQAPPPLTTQETLPTPSPVDPIPELIDHALPTAEPIEPEPIENQSTDSQQASIDILRKFTITSIIPKGNKSRLMANGQIYELGDTLDDNSGLKWSSINPEKSRIYFQDANGTTYFKKY